MIVIALVVLGATVFSCSYAAQLYAQHLLSPLKAIVFGSAPIVLAIAAVGLFASRARWQAWLSKAYLEPHARQMEELPARWAGSWILLAAGLGLFTELMIIRFHASCFQLFGYFKNVSLLSCFLGLGIGYAMGRRRPLLTPLFLPLLAAQLIAMHAASFTYMAVNLHNPVPDQLGFLAEAKTWTHLVTAYGMITVVYVFNTACFVPLGQLASFMMQRRDNLRAYSWNLAGSLAGILAFYVLSLLWMPPFIWTLVVLLCTVPFFARDPRNLIVSATVGSLAVGLLGLSPRLDQIDVFSPYQILSLKVHRNQDLSVMVNHVWYHSMSSEETLLGRTSGEYSGSRALKDQYYKFPFRFKPKPEDVLIVGSGAGNDTSYALDAGAQRIDAVEIDPAILELGRRLHPAAPYADPRVRVVNTDARSFIRHTTNRYDLIVYGLLDSHTLLSSKAGVRLDSYVYTVQAFREARARLKPDGIICVSYVIMSREMGHKMYLMLKEAFDGREPRVFGYPAGYCFVTGNTDSFRSLEQGAATSEFADPAIRGEASTDDWPFFYMPFRRYPQSYAVLIAVLLVLSVLCIRGFGIRLDHSALSGTFFFLGAGFMLVETKGITELALIHGSTWVVVGIVIATILVMAFLANLLVIRSWAPPVPAAYALLLLALGGGWVLAGRSYLLGAGAASALLSTSVLLLPLFFSGFAFSAELRKTESISRAMASNLLGGMLGGLLEYNAMYFGFRFLYGLAALMYVAAYLLRNRK